MAFTALLLKEIRDSFRNKWLILYTVSFAALGLTFSYYGYMGLGVLGFRAFGRVSAALVNMALYMIPLMSMSLAGLSIVGEREKGTLEIILSQPVSKNEIILSKFLGITVSITLATMLGYGIASWYLWMFLSSADLSIYLLIVSGCLALAASLTAFGLIISVISRSRFEALGIILLSWLFLLIIYEFIIIGLTITMKIPLQDLVFLVMINPVEAARLLMISFIDPSLLLLGPSGIYLTELFKAALPYILLGSLLAWTLGSLIISMKIFNLQDL